MLEYASNGTLHEHLHCEFHLSILTSGNNTIASTNLFGYFYADGEGCQFSWTRRMKIIIGIARGLKYLHTQLDPPFTISELNSSSVYLTDDFSPKVRL